MIRKLIGSNFEIDLSHRKLSVNRQNHWFSEDFFTKYTLPFELELTPELDEAFGYISRPNSQQVSTVLPCKYYHGDVIEDAELEIEYVEEKLSCNLFFGIDQLPNWDTQLSSLPLEKFDLPEGTDIYEHAETIISQTYPQVNYNFPQVHTDKIDVENDENYFAFEKIINNRKDGAFLINEVIEENNDSITYNRNIMQPLPSWLYVLKKIFEDVGLTLEGDILDDPVLRYKLIYGDVDYAATVNQESIQDIAISEDFSETNGSWNKYTKSIPITQLGKYRIVGKYYHRGVSAGPYLYYFRIKYRGQLLLNYSSISTISLTLSINKVFETLVDTEPNFLEIEAFQRKTTNKIIWDISVNPIRLHDENGNPIPNLINKNSIDLTKAVPQITCGEFIKLNKNWFNYNLKVTENKAIMNKVVNDLKNNNIVDLSMYEKKYPKRYPLQSTSILLKFSDIDSKDYQFLKVFQNRNGISNSDTLVDDKTTTIEINALPLPLLMRNNVQTVHAFENNSSKVYTVTYKGLQAGLNLAADPSDSLLPNVYENYHKKWFETQMTSQELRERFVCDDVKLLELTPQSIVYMYGRYYLVKEINDTEIKPGIIDLEIYLVSLE